MDLFFGLSLLNVIAAFLVIMMFSALAVLFLIKRYQKNGRIDVPNERSMHTLAIPTGAGIVIVASLAIATLVLALHSYSIQLLAMFIVVTVLGFIGWSDDKNHLSVSSRLLSFVLLAVLLVLGLGVVDEVRFGQGTVFALPYYVAAVFTLLGFIWFVNLYNFMDGMDGLAGVQTVIAATAFSLLFAKVVLVDDALFDALFFGRNLTILCLVLIAATLGFLLWNWSPAKIFLGDVGSLPIGGFFAMVTVIAVQQLSLSVLTCVLILGVFVFDATYTLCARALRGEKLIEAHSSHIYQRLSRTGLAHQTIVLIYAGVMVFFSGTAILWEWQLISGLVTSVLTLIGVIFIQLWVRLFESKRF